MRLKTLAGIILTVFVVTSALMAQRSTAVGVSSTVKANRDYGQLPVTFEANRGQMPGQVKFQSQGKGYTAFLTTGGMVLTLHPSSVAATSNNTQQQAGTTLKFRLLGANANPAVIGEEPQPGKVNYFIGNDPSQWHTNVPTYAKVRYKSVYPGVDLIYYGNHQQLEYDFAVSAGADPQRIQFEIQGASNTSLDADGNLILATTSGKLLFKSPIVYQESGRQRVPVKGGYVIKDASHIGFQLEHYDASKSLVIDPVLLYSTYLGGSGTEQPTGIAVDGSGSVYITGYTNSPNFPLTDLDPLQTGTNHIFVAKLDPDGSNLIYADYIGGNNEDYGMALALDSENNVYLTGGTSSSNFPVVTAYQGQQPGPYSGFLTKVSADGSTLLYSTYIGGNTFDQSVSIGLDNLGEAVIAGYTLSQNFPVANAYQSTASPNQGGVYGVYGFLTKFSADGSSLVYSTYLGGSTDVAQGCTSCWLAPYSTIAALTLDANGNAFVTGSTNTNNFPTTPGAYLATNSTQQASTIGFLTKFSAAGNLDYSSYFYGSSGNAVAISALAVDATGSAYITGSAESDGTFPITSTSICDPATYGFGCSYTFVTKFDPTGSTLLYSTFLGPNNYATPKAISLDSMDDAYVLTGTSSNLLQTTNPIESYTGTADVLLVEIDPTASTQLFSTYLGGSSIQAPSDMALDSTGNIYVVGWTNSVDFPTTQGAYQTGLGGGIDAFVAKIGAESGPSVVLNPQSLQYSALSVGSVSPAQTVVLRNMGSSALSIASITATGDFAETDNCGNNVSAASSCSLSITFAPTAGGARTGSIVVQDDAPGSPHVITLSGVGNGPSAVLSPATLTFTGVPIGQSSALQAVTLTNSGNASLSVGNIQVSGDYAQTNNCPSVLAASASCTINVVFTPTTSGTRTGSLAVNDSAGNSPQSVALSGVGNGPSAVLSPATLTFAGVPIGQSSAAQAVTLTNDGNASLSVSNFQVTGDYAQTNNCPSTLAPNASCTINVVFTPTASGTRTGLLTVNDSAPNSPQSVALSGSGSDFSLTTSTAQATIEAGATATYKFTVVSVGGSFSNAITLSCGSGLPANATCAFSPSQITPGASSVNSTLTITTAELSADETPRSADRQRPVLAACMQLQGFGLFGLVVAGRAKRSKRALILVVLAMLVLGMLLMTGCAGGTGIATQTTTQTAQTYTITVTGTSGTLQHSIPVTLTIQ
jgi:hypothetical protein